MKVAVTTLAFCVAALLALGLVMLYSSSVTQVGGHYLMMQLIWCAFGFTLCVAATALDYQLLKKIAAPIFIVALLLLLLVLVPHIGRKINGARRWFDFHGVRFQPSEFGKSRSSSCSRGTATVTSGRCRPGNAASFSPARSLR